MVRAGTVRMRRELVGANIVLQFLVRIFVRLARRTLAVLKSLQQIVSESFLLRVLSEEDQTVLRDVDDFDDFEFKLLLQKLQVLHELFEVVRQRQLRRGEVDVVRY